MVMMPEELWLLIAESLDGSDIASLSRVNSHLWAILRAQRAGGHLLDLVISGRENAALAFAERHACIDFSVCDRHRRTTLLCVATRGYLNMLQLILSRPKGRSSLEFPGARGDTALILAARYDHQKVVTALLHAGANANAQNSEGGTALSWALTNGNTQIARTLLNAPVDLTCSLQGGLTALWLAVKTRDMVVSELLIAKGGDVERRDAAGETLLCWATKRRSEGFVEMLLRGGADPGQGDRLGRTPLTWAAMTGSMANIQKLLSYGAKLDARDRSGRTPLAWAVVMGDWDLARVLLDRGADPEPIDKFGWTPIAWAAAKGDTRLVSQLLASGACVDTKGSIRQPLMWAVSTRNRSLVQILLQRGANPMRQDLYGWSPLMEAIENEDADMVRLLVSTGFAAVDLKLTNSSGDSALSLAQDLPCLGIPCLLEKTPCSNTF